jgi:hypothetical protein
MPTQSRGYGTPALQALADLRQQQAEPFAFFDVVWLAAVLSLGLVFLAFLMRHSEVQTKP